MKRFSCSDPLSNLLYPDEEEMNPKDNNGYSKEFQEMLDNLDGEDSMEDCGQGNEKKRRLSNFQVKSLEKIFEVDNKLDPERKSKLAQDLGLQPRQVAIWFQNRRARWKTKQLERDYNHLKASYEALKVNYHKLEMEKQGIVAELMELKAKLPEEMQKANESAAKEKPLFWRSQNTISKPSNLSQSELIDGPQREHETTKTNHEIYTILNFDKSAGLLNVKDGLSDSDSNVALNDDSSLLLISPPTDLISSPGYDLSSLCSSSSSANLAPFVDSRDALAKAYQQELVKMEEQCLVSSSEESCDIYSVDQAPSLCWYFPEPRNFYN